MLPHDLLAGERVAPSSDLPAFSARDLTDHLAFASIASLDELPFGVIAMTRGGEVIDYNAFEQRLSGLPRSSVIGRDFFTEIAPCTNNYMVRERFIEAWDNGADLDEEIPYTFSYRMKPTRVVLRLIVRGARGFVVVKMSQAAP